MKEMIQTSASTINWRRLAVVVFGAALWGGATYGALSLSRVRSPWSGMLCGPWGCTAPLEAILACHLAWLLVLLPGVAAVWRLGTSAHALVAGKGLVLAGLTGMFLEWLFQVQAHSFSSFPFMWQRTGLAIMSEVDYPVVPSLVMGIAMLCFSAGRTQCGPASTKTDQKDVYVPHANVP